MTAVNRGSIGNGYLLAVHGLGSADGTRRDAVNAILIVQRQCHIAGEVGTVNSEGRGYGLANGGGHVKSSRACGDNRIGVLEEGNFFCVTVSDSSVGVVGHHIEVESATLGKAGNGIALVGDTGNDTISLIAGFRGLELSGGKVTSINLHVLQVGHTTGSKVDIIAACAIQDKGVPSVGGTGHTEGFAILAGGNGNAVSGVIVIIILRVYSHGHLVIASEIIGLALHIAI